MRLSERVRAIPRSRFGGLILVLGCLVVWSLPQSAGAVNSFVVESRTVLKGTDLIEVRVRLTNDVPLRLLQLPLEMRSTSGGAFITAMKMSYEERLAGSALDDIISYRRFAVLDSVGNAACNDVHPDSGYSTFDDSEELRDVESSPEAALFFRQDNSDFLAPGSDTLGSLVFTFDIDTLAGTFIIDTTCIPPGTFPALFDDAGIRLPFVFAPGLITVLDTAPDTIYVDYTNTSEEPDGSEQNPFPTIQMAIGVVGSSETVILVAPGTYVGPIIYPQFVALTIKAQEGPFKTDIIGDGNNSVVVMDGGEMDIPIGFKGHILDGFTIRDNEVSLPFTAGGITVKSPTIASIYNCIVRDNTSTSPAAGGIEYGGSGGVIANTWIVDNHNSAFGFGVGGVYIGAFADIEFVANTVVGNTNPTGDVGSAGLYLETGVGAVHAPGRPPSVLRAGASQPHVGATAALSRLDNNIFAFNGPGFGIVAGEGSTPEAAYNNIYFGNGQGNAHDGVPFDSLTLIEADPLFVDRSAGDYRITCESPARDSGDAAYLPSDITRDIQGQPRLGPGEPILDIGADEFYDEFKSAWFQTTDTVGCAPLEVTFENLSTYCFDEDWYWQFGAGEGISRERDPEPYTYDTPGVYTVTLVALGERDTDSIKRFDYIRVLGPPSASFTAWATTYVPDSIAILCDPDSCGAECEGDTCSFEYFDTPVYGIVDSVRVCDSITVHFEATGSDEGEEFTWLFGDGDTATGAIVDHLYDTPGSHTVVLNATNACTTATVTRDDFARIDAPLTAEFDADTEDGCAPLEVRFSTEATGGLFEWDFGDTASENNTAVGDTVTHTYNDSGSYDVTLVASNLCGTDSITKTDLIHVKAAPRVTITSDYDSTGKICNPLTVHFGYISNRPITAWEWDFGDDSTSTDSTPVHTYTVGGRSYSVRLIATGECGSDTEILSNYITVSERPTATITIDPLSGCAATTVFDLHAAFSGPVDSSRWFFDDGSNAPGPDAEHTYGTTGDYTPILRFWHGCGASGFNDTSLAAPIPVATTPIAAFAASADSGYAPLTVSFTDLSGNEPTAWIWDFGDGDSSVSQNPAHDFGAGVHTISLHVSNDCGEDTETKTGLIRVGGFAVTVDSTGVSGRTILYSVDVDSVLLPYDRAVNLGGQLTPEPNRGSMSFRFTDSSGIPPFETDMQAEPTLDLPTGHYQVEVTAADPARSSETGSRSLYYRADPIIAIESQFLVNDTLPMDSTIVGEQSSKAVTIRNTAPFNSGIILTVQNPQVTNRPTFELDTAFDSGGSLEPGESLRWVISFTPPSKNTFYSTLQIGSDDPASPDTTIAMRGRGIGEQVPPTVIEINPDSLAETTIDDTVAIRFSEPLIPVALDSVLIVTSQRLDSTLTGERRWTTQNRAMTFRPFGFFPPDDTISVLVRAVIMDVNGNFFDGNGDGVEQRSPDDDYAFTFRTGPGVYPGDADNDGVVNEADILPLGRFWGNEGPPRENPQTGFTMQPATAWPEDRRMTYADADGSGVIDSMDICPIAEFFDREVDLPKAAVESWMAEAQEWPNDVVRGLYSALEVCPDDGSGRTILLRFLGSLQTTSAPPRDYALAQNYPNPFNPTTVIEYTLPEESDVRLEIFDIRGRRVRTLEAGLQDAGRHIKIWDGRDDQGDEAASGVYLYRLRSPNYSFARKMILLR
jgi:PKD repeat protein